MRRLTKQEFIEKSNKIHNNLYDYSKAEYINNLSKVIITCSLHGDFVKEVGVHFKGHGCPTCAKESMFSNTSDFIKRATEVYGDRFDYSKVVCTGFLKKVNIVCKQHGEFEQSLLNHLRSEGCKGCAKEKRTKTVETFIEEAIRVHGDRYDYNNSIYVNAKTKISIVCKIHGVFEQIPSTHLYGGGCEECGIVKRAEKKVSTTMEYIEKAIKVHGSTYDYSKSNYQGCDKKIEIGCSTHGYFLQIASGHLSGSGCPECVGKKPLTTNTFIEKANKLHKDVYEYSKVNFINSKEKITITCRNHGDFEQTPNSHLNKQGCPQCGNESHWKRSDYIKKANGRICTFYTLRCFNENEEFYKIGITVRTIQERYSTIKKMPYRYEIISQVYGEAGFIWDLELTEKRNLRDFHYLPKIEFGGSKNECFTYYN